MANINSNVIRFEAGGILELVDGATTHTILNLWPGTIRYTMPFVQPLPRTDRSVQQQPLEGDKQLAEIEFELYLTKDTTNQIVDLADDRTSPASNLVKEYTVNVKYAESQGASTGTVRAFSNAFFREAPQVQHGTDYDKVTIRMYARAAAALTTY